MTTWMFHPRLWQALWWLSMATVLTLALMPAPPKQIDLGWDKLNHLAAFGVMTMLGLGAKVWRFAPQSLHRHGAYAALATAISLQMLAFGGLIEVLQSFTPTRFAEWGDLVADSLGIALGLVAMTLWRARLASREWPLPRHESRDAQ